MVMRKARLAFRILTLVVSIQIAERTVTNAQTNEVFRLARGVVYAYDFYELSYSWNFSSYATTQDSGIVEYTIVDSTIVADTTVAWSVLQKRNLFRRAHGSNVPDTSYFVRDSTFFTLNESRTGQHELRGGVGGVWVFPMGQASRVFRYSDSTRVQLGWLGGGNCHVIPGTYDTLSMSVDSSLWRRNYGVCVDWDDYGNLFQRRARLRSLMIVSVQDIPLLPKAVRLNQNHPNPFNPKTTISFSIPNSSFVTLKVFDLLGREIATLVNEDKSAGTHIATWDGRNNSGVRVSSGVYFYHLEVKPTIDANTSGTGQAIVATKKLIFLK
jgi:hypothetical protein